MKKLSKVICLVLSALMLLSLAACGKQAGGADDAQGKPIEGGTFVYAIEEPITSLNWYNNSSTDLGKQVFQNLYDPMWKSTPTVLWTIVWRRAWTSARTVPPTP